MMMRILLAISIGASAHGWKTFQSVAIGASQGQTYALIVNGISKAPRDRALKNRTFGELRAYLLDKAGVDPNRLIALTAEEATAMRLESAMDTFASRVGREDRFIFYYIGQANAVAGSLRLNLLGQDVTDASVALWLSRIEANTQLTVLDCPCAAIAAKKMAKRGRILLLASTAEQVYSTRFSLHFVPALVQEESDTDADGRVSVLEAFAAAARGIEQWYRDAGILATETPHLEDNADGVPSERPWRYTLDGADGSAASKLFLTKL